MGKAVTAEGEDTVVFTLKYPYAPFAQRTVLPIAPEHIAGEQDVNTGAFTTKPIGTGPYVLTKWSKGEQAQLHRQPHYWGGEPEVKKFTMAIIKDDDVRATRLRSGDLDGAILPPNLAKGFANDKGKKTLRREQLRLPHGDAAHQQQGRAGTPPCAAPSMWRSTGRRWSTPSSTAAANRPTGRSPPTASGSPRARSASTMSPPRRRSWTRPGWKPGKDGVRVKDGVRAAFPLWYLSGDKLRQEHALAYASDAKKAGIDIRTEAGPGRSSSPG
ncbi:ABC transporter substrate-binding protein OS=Streptomyces cyaneofuscatus OX=66883 GN=G3I52_08655 PE=3 SV=1 [Streptomyces cyaneofuscatus]